MSSSRIRIIIGLALVSVQVMLDFETQKTR